MTHDPSACLATRPTSTVRSRSPNLIDSFKYFLTVIFVRLLLTRPGDHRPARSVSSTAIWVCTLVAWVPKIEKAAEPGREALAAFFDCKAARVAWFLYRRHVRLGSSSSITRAFFRRFEDSPV